MNTADEDLALKTLMEVRSAEAPDLDLLRRCFLIQKRFQFSADPTIPATQMEGLIDGRVDETISKNDA
jgi:hypothetical protein